MINITIQEIKEILDVNSYNITNLKDKIERVSINSLDIKHYTLFVPIKGKNVDPHIFIEKVVEEKSNYALTEREDLIKIPNTLLVKDTINALQEIGRYNRKKFSGIVIAITGSNGKTTTKNIIAEILKNKYNIIASYKNENNYIGLPLNLTKIKNEHKIGIFEVGISIPGEMEKLASILIPNISIITSIGLAHTLHLKNEETIIQEKSKLIEFTSELALINGDIPTLYNYIQKEYKEKKIIKFGENEKNEFVFKFLNKSTGTLVIILKNKTKDEIFETNFIGIDNRYSLYAAISTLLILGLSINEIKTYIKNVYPVEGRLSYFYINDNLIIDDSYNANYNSIINLIKTVDTIRGYNNKYIILGEMLELGEKEEELHKKLVNNIKEYKKINFILKGEIYKKLTNNSNNIKILNTNEEIINEINNILKLKNNIIAFKGSHATEIYKIVNTIKERI